MIRELKISKQMEIDMGCDKYIDRQITIGKQVFNASVENLMLYKQAYDLGLSLGMTKGRLPTANGVEVIEQSVIEELIKTMGIQVSKGLVKKTYYYMAITKATTEAEIEAIVWEDVRKK